MKTPIFGGDAVSRSKNLADNQLWNLYGEICETRDGKAVGALYSVPGLDLLMTAGNGPIRAGGLAAIGNTGYAVSGQNVYSFNTSYGLTFIGQLPTAITSPVSMVTNGKQLIIFDGVGGYLVPGGYPLTGGAISPGGSSYAIGDDITLINTDGTSNATAVLTVTGVSGGAVTSFDVTYSGVFDPQPTGFTQASTDGSGSGFVLTAPTYGAFLGIYPVTLPFPNPIYGTYQDGFGLVEYGNSQIFSQSNLNDLSVWDPLNFTSEDATPDNIQVVKDIHREVWVLKDQHSAVYVNAGQAGFSFQRLEGVYLEVGIVAPFSVANSGESLIWLSRNTHGDGIVVMTQGYQAVAISTQAMVDEIQTYSTLTDAVGYVYQQSQHSFYVLTFPSANATWVYDVTASALAGVPMWHRRAAFSNGAQNRHWSNAYLNFNGVNLVGDYRNGNIYAFNLENYTDNGSPRKWQRTWRALKQPVLKPVKFAWLQIDMETGITVPAGVNPLCQLRCSDDDGHNWPISRISSLGKTGQTAFRVKFTRLGSTRRNSGLDRIFELSSTANCRAAIINAEIG